MVRKKEIQPNQIAMGLLNFNSADAKGHLQHPDIDVINMKLHDDIIIIITIIVVNLHKTWREKMLNIKKNLYFIKLTLFATETLHICEYSKAYNLTRKRIINSIIGLMQFLPAIHNISVLN